MKKTLAVILVALLVCVLAGCRKSEPELPYNDPNVQRGFYENQALGVRLEYPYGWALFSKEMATSTDLEQDFQEAFADGQKIALEDVRSWLQTVEMALIDQQEVENRILLARAEATAPLGDPTNLETRRQLDALVQQRVLPGLYADFQSMGEPEWKEIGGKIYVISEYTAQPGGDHERKVKAASIAGADGTVLVFLMTATPEQYLAVEPVFEAVIGTEKNLTGKRWLD